MHPNAEIANLFIVSSEVLPSLLMKYSDKALDHAESWAKAVVAGRNIRISGHTPRGMCISESCGKRVLDAVRNEQTRRFAA